MVLPCHFTGISLKVSLKFNRDEHLSSCKMIIYKVYPPPRKNNGPTSLKHLSPRPPKQKEATPSFNLTAPHHAHHLHYRRRPIHIWKKCQPNTRTLLTISRTSRKADGNRRPSANFTSSGVTCQRWRSRANEDSSRRHRPLQPLVSCAKLRSVTSTIHSPSCASSSIILRF